MDLLDLFVKVGYDDSAVDSGIAGTSKKGSGFAKTLGKSFRVAAAGVAAISAAVVGISTAFVASAKSTAAYGDNVDKLSQKIGFSREGFQKWDFVMSQNGMSIETMQTGMKTLTSRLDDAITGSSDAEETFSRLGLSLDELSGLSQEELFEKSLTALQGVSDETTRAAIASDLFGRSATELAPLLNQTADSTAALMEQAELYGLVMSDEAVDASVAFTDSLDLMQRTFTGLKNRMMAEYLPALTDVTDGLALLFTGDTSGIDQIADGISSIAEKLLDAIPTIAKVGGSILSALGKAVISKLPTLSKVALEIIGGLVNGITKALPELAKGAVSIISGIIDLVIDNIGDLLEASIEIVAAISDGIADSLPELIPAVIETILFLIETLIDNADMLIDGAIELVTGLADGIIDSLPILVEKIPELILSIINAIVDNLPSILESGVDIILALVDGLVNAIPDLVEAIPDIIMAIIQAFGDAAPDIREAGADLISGIWDGMNSMGQWLWDKISDFAGELADAFRSAFNLGDAGVYVRGGTVTIGSNTRSATGTGGSSALSVTNNFYTPVSTPSQTANQIGTTVSGALYAYGY